MSAPVAQASLLLCGVLLLLGAIFDIGVRRIPNVIPGVIVLLAMIHQVARSGWGALGLSWIAGLAVTALLWVPWMKGGLGGGDVKLAGAGAMVVGLWNLPIYLMVSALAGGVVSLVCLFFSSRAVRGEVRTNLFLAVLGHGLEVPARAVRGSGRVSVPYGVSFVIGAYACMLGVTV